LKLSIVGLIVLVLKILKLFQSWMIPIVYLYQYGAHRTNLIQLLDSLLRHGGFFALRPPNVYWYGAHRTNLIQLLDSFLLHGAFFALQQRFKLSPLTHPLGYSSCHDVSVSLLFFEPEGPDNKILQKVIPVTILPNGHPNQIGISDA
jgi:hypothetical protein